MTMPTPAKLASAVVAGLLSIALAGCTIGTTPEPSETMGTVPPPAPAHSTPPPRPVVSDEQIAAIEVAPTDYVVVEGDTAWGMARAHGIPIWYVPNGWLHPGDVIDLTVDRSDQWREYLDSTN
ncbi:LysM domain-containing protein [Microbacterium sp. KSW4-11]|uniref:LysM domain-containing protein n=1 Tax=Microbacterium gawkjiense TaxID=3067309 RepID=A0ABU3G7Q3_9MICO|nr:LysM domain-containing protein [Microbacterium sp. KSW4-11]MDT3315530.1 LysM domain-containing protein [Microbacterium sp. KSW4-11]